MRSTECSFQGVWVAEVPHSSEWMNRPYDTLLSDILSKGRARLCQRPGTQEALVCLGLFFFFFVLFFVCFVFCCCWKSGKCWWF